MIVLKRRDGRALRVGVACFSHHLNLGMSHGGQHEFTDLQHSYIGCPVNRTELAILGRGIVDERKITFTFLNGLSQKYSSLSRSDSGEIKSYRP